MCLSLRRITTVSEIRRFVPSSLRLGISGTLAMPSSQTQPSDQPTNDHSTGCNGGKQAEPNSPSLPPDNGQFPARALAQVSQIFQPSLPLALAMSFRSPLELKEDFERINALHNLGKEGDNITT